jgi:hypothetical protein
MWAKAAWIFDVALAHIADFFNAKNKHNLIAGEKNE